MPFADSPDNLSGAAITLAIATCPEPALCALTAREQREYDALPHAARRRDWLAGRCAAKRAIGARFDMTADWIELTSVPHAAPRASVRHRARGWAPINARLTLSHRDGVAVAAAFAPSSWVGVDVERAGAVSQMERRYFLSEGERLSHRDIDATLVWVLKEAAWKALKLGAATPLSSLQLAFHDDGRHLIAVRRGGVEHRATARIARIDGPRALIAALVQISPELS
jgi:phosphopantetheinyl transferase (holo-ACP synthase)